MTERFYNRQNTSLPQSSFLGIHRVSTTIRTSQRMPLLDVWKKHEERYATVIADDRGNAARLRSSMRDREQLLFAARVDIDVNDVS
ncbi:hypothetical protein AVEN_14248-1 [Araneus ventricosus]|uniref:Uncharacterized protein n=1 Tax=Araneus ventricosus TaxID=182803 RepID=A0A4Y2GHA3_ARAVE|nr:hypothetical protein AVEN_14248-1 [Araneus ventricosus]